MPPQHVWCFWDHDVSTLHETLDGETFQYNNILYINMFLKMLSNTNGFITWHTHETDFRCVRVSIYHFRTRIHPPKGVGKNGRWRIYTWRCLLPKQQKTCDSTVIATKIHGISSHSTKETTQNIGSTHCQNGTITISWFFGKGFNHLCCHQTFNGSH